MMEKYEAVINWDKVRDFCQMGWKRFEYSFDIQYNDIEFEFMIIDFELGQKEIERAKKNNEECPIRWSHLTIPKCGWDISNDNAINITVSIPKHFILNMDDLTLDFLILHELGHSQLNPMITTGLDVEIEAEQYAIEILDIDKQQYYHILFIIDDVFEIPNIIDKHDYLIFQQQKIDRVCQLNKWEE